MRRCSPTPAIFPATDKSDADSFDGNTRPGWQCAEAAAGRSRHHHRAAVREVRSVEAGDGDGPARKA